LDISLNSVFHIAAMLIYLILASISFSSDIKSALNRLSALIFLLFALMSFSEFMLTIRSINPDSAYLFDKLSSLVWISIPVLICSFLLHITDRAGKTDTALFRLSSVIFISVFIYASLADLLTQSPVLKANLWYSEWKPGIWLWAYLLYLTLFILYGFWNIIDFAFNIRGTETMEKRAPARLVFYFTLISFTLALIFQFAFPLMFPGFTDSPYFAFSNFHMLIWAAGTLYAVTKYNLLRFSTTEAVNEIVSAMSDTLIILSTGLKIVFVNEAATRTLKTGQENLIGRYFKDFMSDIEYTKFLSVSNTNRQADLELTIGDGSKLHLNFSISVIRSSGKPRAVLLVARDISEKIAYERNIRLEVEKASHYLETAGVMFVITDIDCRVTKVNRKTLQVLGLENENHILGTIWADNFLTPESSLDYMRLHKQAMQGNLTEYSENTVITTEGRLRLIKWNHSLIKDANNVITGLISAGNDITEEKENEQQIRTLSTVVNQSPNSIVLTDLNGHITYVNPRTCSLTGYTREELLGENPRIFKSGNTPEDTYKKMKDGTLIWESVTIAPIKNDTGAITAFMGIRVDITEQKKIQDELKSSYEKLKELDVMKASFMSMVSHELRTPITSIKGFLAFMLGGVGGPVTAQQREFLEIMKNNSERLLNLINDLLDVAKIEAGSFSITKSDSDLIATIRSVIKDTSSLAGRKKIKAVITSPHASLIFSFDEYRISQTLINLINNSIKFSPDNSVIEVSASFTDFTGITVPEYINHSLIPGARIVRIEVKDNGVGLTPENAGKIFSRFYQVENINTRRQQGTGLGLSIVKSIVELHGGCVWARSEGPGTGTSIIILLPV